jgi:spermidine synthase
MTPWELLDSSNVVGEAEKLTLSRRGDEYSIKTGYSELMNSRMHGSEDALAALGCKCLKNKSKARVLIGGLGMGFTLAEALKHVADDAEVVVAELVPAVIQWNQTHLSHLAGYPLKDKRVRVHQGDVGNLIRAEKGGFDAILLDVDNGPEGLTRKENSALYSPNGLKLSKAALRPNGVFGVWSAFPEPRFTRMQQAGFKTEEIPCRAHGKRGSKHMIWLGK